MAFFLLRGAKGWGLSSAWENLFAARTKRLATFPTLSEVRGEHGGAGPHRACSARRGRALRPPGGPRFAAVSRSFRFLLT